MKRPRLNYQLARLATVSILFFLGALVAYAVVRQIYVDSGLEGVRAEKLVTQVNQSVTIGDITIRLDWAYADISRISFGFSLVDAEGNVVIPSGGELHYSAAMELTVENEDGSFSSVTEPDVLDFYIVSYQQTEQQVYNQIFFLEKLPETQLQVDLQMQFPNIAGIENQSFEFSFPLIVYPALFSSEGLLMESAETQMVLDEFSISSTLTSANICFDLPDELQREENFVTGSSSVWYGSDIQIYFDAVNVAELYPDISGYFGGLELEDDTACTTVSLAIPLDTLPNTVRISLSEMREIHGGYYNMEEAQALRAISYDHGVNMTINRIDPSQLDGGDYTRLFYFYWPKIWWGEPVFEQMSLYDAAIDDFFSTNPQNFRITGPWEIEFELQDPLN